jgi:hypothetical protein
MKESQRTDAAELIRDPTPFDSSNLSWPKAHRGFIQFGRQVSPQLKKTQKEPDVLTVSIRARKQWNLMIGRGLLQQKFQLDTLLRWFFPALSLVCPRVGSVEQSAVLRVVGKHHPRYRPFDAIASGVLQGALTVSTPLKSGE